MNNIAFWIIFLLLPLTTTVYHYELILMWTEKHLSASVRIRSIAGDPGDWIKSKSPIITGQASPSDNTARYLSARIALGYNYKYQEIYWTDRNYKEVTKAQLQAQEPGKPYMYTAAHIKIYKGTSSEINGLAVDWLSDTIYWTDALYNWITAANANKYDVYRHIVTTGLDRPMGIAVYPQIGKMYWSDWGAISKIEEASLDGTDRRVLINTDLGKPMGVCVDYAQNRLYWVDDWHDTINWRDLETGHRENLKVESLNPGTGQHGHLFGISVWNQYIFVTDQIYHTMRVYDKYSKELLTNLLLGTGNVPYDVMMYAEDLQENMKTQCPTLNCEDMCVSTGGGKGQCMCRQGFTLDSDGKSCKGDDRLTQPIFVYTIGHSLCGSRITMSDRGQVHPMGDTKCFFDDVSHARALAFQARGEFIYFSDVDNNTISRIRPHEGNHDRIEIAANAGIVKGMVVDWIAENLYWADESAGTITVSKMDGRFHQVILRNLGKPRGVAVNPFTGKLYWADGQNNQLFQANADGTNVELFVYDMTEPDGIVLDITERRLYWAEATGIKSVQLDGTDRKSVYQRKDTETFRSVSVYQDYYAYTDGQSMVYYGLKSDGSHTDPEAMNLRPIQHINSMVSHDIISYSEYLQPTSTQCDGLSCLQSPCQENNGGCDQLCLPKENEERVCKCCFGWALDVDGQTCLTNMVDKQFILLVDPFHRQIYQMDLSVPSSQLPTLSGVPISTSDFPTLIDLDIVKRDIVWLDKAANAILKAHLYVETDKKRRRRAIPDKEQLVHVIPEDTSMTAFVVSSKTRELLYSDLEDQTIYRIGLDKDTKSTFASNSPATYMAIYEEGSELYWVENADEGSVIYSKNVLKSSSKTKLRTSETITAISFDTSEEKLYWCTKSKIMRSDMYGRYPVKVLDYQGGDYNNVAVTNTHIYFSFSDKKILYRSNKKGNTSSITAVTDPIFSKITSIKDYSWLEERAKYKDYSQEPTDPVKVWIPATVVGIVVALLLLALIVALCYWRGMCKKKVPRSDFEVQAHENPTYMSNKEMTGQTTTNDPIYLTLPGGAVRNASAGSRDSDLPDVVKMKLPEDEISGAPYDQGPNVLNENTVKPSQVVMKRGSERTLSVQYNKY